MRIVSCSPRIRIHPIPIQTHQPVLESDLPGINKGKGCVVDLKIFASGWNAHGLVRRLGVMIDRNRLDHNRGWMQVYGYVFGIDYSDAILRREPEFAALQASAGGP